MNERKIVEQFHYQQKSKTITIYRERENMYVET